MPFRRILIRLLLNRVMEWLDIILLIEMISGEVFSSKKGSTDRGKMYESIQEFLNPNKTKAWTLRQFKE